VAAGFGDIGRKEMPRATSDVPGMVKRREIGKENEKRKRGKSKQGAKDEKVNRQGGKVGRRCPALNSSDNLPSRQSS